MTQPPNPGQNPAPGNPGPGQPSRQPNQPGQRPPAAGNEQRVRTRVVPQPGQPAQQPPQPQQPAQQPYPDPLQLPYPDPLQLPYQQAWPQQPQQPQQNYPYPPQPGVPPGYPQQGMPPGYPQQPAAPWMQGAPGIHPPGMHAPGRVGGPFSLARGGTITLFCGLVVLAVALLGLLVVAAIGGSEGTNIAKIAVMIIGGLGLVAVIIGECLCFSVPKEAGKVNMIGAVILQVVAVAAGIIAYVTIGSDAIKFSGSEEMKRAETSTLAARRGGSSEAIWSRAVARIPVFFAAIPALFSLCLVAGFGREANKFLRNQPNIKTGLWVLITVSALAVASFLLMIAGVFPRSGSAMFWVFMIISTVAQIAAIGLAGFYLLVTNRAMA